MQEISKFNWDEELTLDEVERFKAIHGQRGAKILSLLGKHKDFYIAINTELGKQLLKDVMARMEIVLDDIVEDNFKLKRSRMKAHIEYKMLRDLFNRWTKRIAIYTEGRQKIIKGEI